MDVKYKLSTWLTEITPRKEWVNFCRFVTKTYNDRNDTGTLINKSYSDFCLAELKIYNARIINDTLDGRHVFNCLEFEHESDLIVFKLKFN